MARKNDTADAAEPRPLGSSPMESDGDAGVPIAVRVHQPSAAQVRIECLKLAMEMRVAVTGTRAVIVQAKEFESYVTGNRAEPDHRD